MAIRMWDVENGGEYSQSGSRLTKIFMSISDGRKGNNNVLWLSKIILRISRVYENIDRVVPRELEVRMEVGCVKAGYTLCADYVVLDRANRRTEIRPQSWRIPRNMAPMLANGRYSSGDLNRVGIHIRWRMYGENKNVGKQLDGERIDGRHSVAEHHDLGENEVAGPG